MPSGDSRKDYICTAAGHYFGLQSNDDAVTNLVSESALNTFLDDAGSVVLCIRFDGRKTHASNEVSWNCSFSLLVLVTLELVLVLLVQLVD
jgi:hypothetical protein